jgi:hypothetical protein
LLESIRLFVPVFIIATLNPSESSVGKAAVKEVLDVSK